MRECREAVKAVNVVRRERHKCSLDVVNVVRSQCPKQLPHLRIHGSHVIHDIKGTLICTREGCVPLAAHAIHGLSDSHDSHGIYGSSGAAESSTRASTLRLLPDQKT